MITIAQSHQSADVINHFNPQVAVAWFTSGGRPIDSFSRSYADAYSEFAHAAELAAGPRGRLTEGDSAFVAGDIIYITAVAARSGVMNNVINPSTVENHLTDIGNAMRKEGLTKLALPVISSGRNVGLRTRNYLDMIDRILPDMEVYVSTGVPLDNHGRAYADISTNPKSTIRPAAIIRTPKKIVVPTGVRSPYGNHYAI